ncbi:MAG: hypothetical protein ACREBS_02290, partial [Nitrososphaerales archaeon]
YTIQLYTNNTLAKYPAITNITLVTGLSDRTQIIRFHVSVLSYLFISPSWTILQNSNGSAFYLTYYPGGATIPTAFDPTDNLLYTAHQTQGWIQINSAT